jgi:hypothetical protein
VTVISYFLFSLEYRRGLHTNRYLKYIPCLGRIFFIAAMGAFALVEGETWLVNIIVAIREPIIALLHAFGIAV